MQDCQKRGIIIPHRKEHSDMPKIIPIRDLKNTTAISNMCHESSEPIYITKNGYSDLVVMSAEVYDKALLLQDVFLKLDEAENDIAQGKTKDAKESLTELKKKYEL